MKKIKSLIFLLTVFSLLPSCHILYEKQKVWDEIDFTAYKPKQVFVHKKYLYFLYEIEDRSFYLSAKFSDKKSLKRGKNAVLKLEMLESISDIDESEKEHIILAKDVLPLMLEKTIKELAPKDINKGIMIFTAVRDYVLYKDFAGNIKLSDFSSVPEDIKISGNISKKKMRKKAYFEMQTCLKELYPDKEKFIIPIDNFPLTPYIYVDIKNGIAAAVQLPDYYQLNKDISPIGFYKDILYSFFIKSHIFAIIKAPFTSAHRLFSTVVYSLYSGFAPQIENLKEIPPLNESGEMMDINSFEHFLDHNITVDKFKGKANILIDGETFFSDFFEKAIKSKKSIDIRVYIFKTDPYSLTIADLLKSVSNKGIDVKVITDEINTVLNWTKDPKLIYSKDYIMPNIKKYLREDSNVKIRTVPNTWVNVDHRKTIIIDDKLAYMGGMNFGEEYRYLWHDLMLSLEGPIVTKLKDDFQKTWAYTGIGGDFAVAARAVFKSSPDYTKDIRQDMYDIRALYTKPTTIEIFNAQIEAIKRAKNRIYIENPYFSDIRFIQELIKARGRGVDVRVILPIENDIGLMNSNNSVKANIMLNNGIKVYFYPKMSHVKAAIYDNWACIGSANFDKLSLYICNEMSLGISDPAFVEDLNNKLFQKDFEESELMIAPFELNPGDYIMSTLAAQG